MINALPRIAIAVNDFDAALRYFGDSLGMPIVDLSASTAPDLGASVALCVPEGGSNIEIMSPAAPDMALAQALQRFLDQRGEGLYALMLEAPVPDTEAEEIVERGLSVLPLMPGAAGRDIHPRSTHGVLIRVYPDNSVGRIDPEGGKAPGLSGIEKVIIATDDAEKAADAYIRGLGLGSIEADDTAVSDDAERGVVSVRVRAPKGGVIELVSVSDSSRPFAAEIERFLTTGGKGMFALVLRAADRAATRSVLADRGVELELFDPLDEDSALITNVFGTRLMIE